MKRAGMKMNHYLKETKLLDYSAASLQQLAEQRGWRRLEEFDRIKAIYDFVRNEILFGYNVSDELSASAVLADGYGQCNTKGTLFMALLRLAGIPCRSHGFMIDKQLQRGVMTGLIYKLAPKRIFHSWVEVYFENRWYELEAFILDDGYFRQLQNKFVTCEGAFCGYGAAVADFKHPIIEWNRNHTYIQSLGIVEDFGVYDSPDELLEAHGQSLNGIKTFAYIHLGRHLMNQKVKKIRESKG